MKAEIWTKRFINCPKCMAESWEVGQLSLGSGSNGMPTESEWPERDGGRLAWLAEMQRDARTKGEA